MKKVLFFRLLLMTACIISIVQVIHGQTRQISGKVYNTETGSTLPNIVLKLKGTTITATTNSFGKYKLTIPDSITEIVFEESPSVKINRYHSNRDGLMDVYVENLTIHDLLALSFDDLLNLTVTTAGKKEEQIAEIPASVVVITRQDIEKYGFRDIPEILRNVPGFYLIDDLFYSNIGVRGFWNSTPNRNMVLMVNGIPQNEDTFSYTFIDGIKISPEAIDRIEIVRGPMSIMYGSGAFLAAVNIITNEADENNDHNLVSISYGTDNSKNLALRTTSRENDLQYTFNGTYYKTDGPNFDIGEMGGPSGLDTEDRLSSDKKYLNFSGKFKKFNFDMSLSDDKKEGLFVFPPTPGDDGIPYSSTLFRFSLAYLEKFSDKLSLKSKISYLTHRWEFEQENWVYEGYYGMEKDRSKAVSAELNLLYNPRPSVNLLFGASHYSIFDCEIMFIHPDFNYHNFIQQLDKGQSRNSYALFAQGDYQVSDHLKLVAGLRLEQVPKYGMAQKYNLGYTDEQIVKGTYNQSDPELISRLAMIYSPDTKNYLKLIYGTAINQPSFFQNGDLVDIRRNLGHSSVLSPEKIQTVELNYIGQIAAKSILNISLFNNTFNDLIFRSLIIDASGTAISYHENTGKMRTNGLEMSFQYNQENKYGLEASVTYQTTKNKRVGFEHLESAYSPSLLAYLRASVFLNKNVSVAFTANYVDQMWPYWDSTLPVGNGSYGKYLGEKVDGYFLANANLRVRRLFNTNAYLNCFFGNVFNAKIKYPTSVANNWATKGTPGKGREFLLTLGWKF